MSAIIAIDVIPDEPSGAELPQDRRAHRTPFRRRKSDVLRIVANLHGVGFTPDQIAAGMQLTVRRVRQVMQFLRLGQPAFSSAGEALTWLSKERPDLDHELRYFRNGKDGSAD